MILRHASDEVNIEPALAGSGGCFSNTVDGTAFSAHSKDEPQVGFILTRSEIGESFVMS